MHFAGDADDIRCMAAARAFGVIHMNGAELPGVEGVDGAEGGCKQVRVRLRGLARGFVSIWLSVSQTTELAYVELKPEVQ